MFEFIKKDDMIYSVQGFWEVAFVSTLSATIKPFSAMTMSPGHRLELLPKSRDFSSP